MTERGNHDQFDRWLREQADPITGHFRIRTNQFMAMRRLCGVAPDQQRARLRADLWATLNEQGLL